MAVVPSAMSRKAARPTRRSATGALLLGACAAAAAMWKGHSAFAAAPKATPAMARAAVQLRASSPVQEIANPVKTVSETVADFYKAYPQPPVMPMYRTFLIDALASTHLAIVDTRFKYDAVFALGLQEYFNGLMGTYDKMMAGAPETAKIWKAYCSALGLDSEKVAADAAVASDFASGTAPAEILAAMEGGEGVLADAFSGISTGLYTMPFSVGLFKMMQLAGVELSKANAEEWAKALKVTPSKATGDLETYKLNQDKLQKAEEMLREIEIREKKKLAQQLEEKAKALAAKASGKAEEAEKEPAMA